VPILLRIGWMALFGIALMRRDQLIKLLEDIQFRSVQARLCRIPTLEVASSRGPPCPLIYNEPGNDVLQLMTSTRLLPGKAVTDGGRIGWRTLPD